MGRTTDINELRELYEQMSAKAKDNFNGVVKKFEQEGLKAESYLQACVKQPQLFCQSPKTIAEHINVMLFGNINSNNTMNNSLFLAKKLQNPVEFTFSSSLLMLKYLIIPKMFDSQEIPKELKGNNLKLKMQKYLEANPDKIYTLSVKGESSDIELLRKCIKELPGCDGRFIIKVL